ncbi:hypothetical protein CBW65_17700 [Tumebacillus avium]|uniref:Transposase (putative) YhgA-like domain-containing protein n=1 Tax=Tumebacillus avium TaxID=1903704 RepID=A0A1Y0IPU1_9BACL|nr:hypothetical protein [Tumebacillus avium]ARU62598.1 hypothetical protein CBW65_17700 [Tumebacillus avium]
MKLLFSLSDRPTLDLLNGLFGETFSISDTKVIRGSTEFVGSDLTTAYADSLLVVLREKEQKKYHVEFQTYDDHSMIIRMFEYGYQIAKQGMEKDLQQLVIRFPHQLVLYLERDDSIQDELSCVIELPPYEEPDRLHYKVPVKKFWNIKPRQFQTQLYALIPFHVFASRKEILDIIKDKSITSVQRTELVHQELLKVLRIIESTHESLIRIRDEGKMELDDLDKMVTVTANLAHHLYQKFYTYFESFYEEVETMLTSLINHEALAVKKKEAWQEGMERGRQEGIKEGIKEGIEQGVEQGLSEFVIDSLDELGPVDDALKERVRSVKDIQQLKTWGKLAARASSVEEFVRQIEQ